MQFKNIIGHEKEINILKNAVICGKVGHAFLFSGPAGVGKRLTAFAFGGALNCKNFNGDACGECPDCRLLGTGNHPNLIFVSPTDKDGNEAPDGLVKIDRVREIQNLLRFKADGRKVVIVDGADRMQPVAANAFLKTLEEPPEGSVIILLSSCATGLLPTMVSRCQKINFRPLPKGAVAAFLSKHKGLKTDDAEMIAAQSCGSIATALKSMDGAGERRGVLERLVQLAPGDIDGALKLAEELSKRDDLDDILELIKTWHRDVAVSSVCEARFAANPFSAAPEGLIKELCARFSAVEGARRDIMPPRYANKQLTMEALMLRLIESKPAVHGRLG